MRAAIKDLKKRCISIKGVKLVNGRKVHRMLYAIKEREGEEAEQQDKSESSGYDSIRSPIIGQSDN